MKKDTVYPRATGKRCPLKQFMTSDTYSPEFMAQGRYCRPYFDDI